MQADKVDMFEMGTVSCPTYQLKVISFGSKKTHLYMAVRCTRLGISLGRRRRVPAIAVRWSGGITPRPWHRRRCGWTDSIHEILLRPCLLLLLLYSMRTRFNQSVLNRSCCFHREHRPSVQRPRYRLFPSLQHLIQFLAYLAIDQAICIHKRLVEVATEEERVRRPNVLDDGIEHVQGWELTIRRSLFEHQ